jgi:hypothetical protein
MTTNILPRQRMDKTAFIAFRIKAALSHWGGNTIDPSPIYEAILLLCKWGTFRQVSAHIEVRRNKGLMELRRYRSADRQQRFRCLSHILKRVMLKYTASIAHTVD